MSTTLTDTPEEQKEPQPVKGLAREPVLVRGFVVALVSFAVAFGLDLTSEQQASSIDLISFSFILLAPVVSSMWSRRHVSPTATVAAQVDEHGVTRSGPADPHRDNGAPVTVQAATTAQADVTGEATHA